MRRKNEKGMTLVELLIVVAIIGIIAAIAIPNLLQSIQRSKISRTLADLSAVKSAIGAYMVDNNHYPMVSEKFSFGSGFSISKWEPLTSDLLPEKYYTGTHTDAWGIIFSYVSDADGQNYAVRSYGTDQQANTGDWIWANWFFDKTWYFKGSWPTSCWLVPYEDMRQIIEDGCDLAFVNGSPAGVSPY